MKAKLIVLCLFVLINFEISAQERELNSGFGLGFQLVQFQNDFGLGLNFVSPYFADGHIGIRLKANLMYNQNVIDGLTEWVPYGNASLGLIGVGTQLSENIRLYGEGGFLILIPSDKLSSEDVEIGGYGHFGFEFFFSQGGCYFIEIGGVGTGAVADKIPSEPIFSNGMSISAGLRYFLQ